jgi:hypothetical protein
LTMSGVHRALVVHVDLRARMKAGHSAASEGIPQNHAAAAGCDKFRA